MQEITVATGKEIPQNEDPAYVQAMIDKADGVTTEPSPVTQEEKLYAGKYKSIEDLEKGYQELQKAFSSKRTPNENTQTPNENTNDLTIPDNPQEVLADKGLDFTEFSEEWRTTGTLSEESYEKLTKAGIPKQMVDSYIEGMQLKAQEATNQVFGVVGGQEEYSKLVQWAAANLPPSEIQAYNEAIASENLSQMVLATRGLKASFEEARGKTPQLLDGSISGDTSRGDRFESMAQVKAAMADTRYQKDPAYRQQVIDKLSRSNVM